MTGPGRGRLRSTRPRRRDGAPAPKLPPAADRREKTAGHLGTPSEDTIAFSDTLVALGVPHVFEAYEGDHRDRMSERLPGRVLPWIDGRLTHE